MLAHTQRLGMRAAAAPTRRGVVPLVARNAATLRPPAAKAPRLGAGFTSLRPCVASAAVAVREGRAPPARDEVITGKEGNNVSDYIYEKMGANLHQQPDHPIGIIKQVRGQAHVAVHGQCAIAVCSQLQTAAHWQGWMRLWIRCCRACNCNCTGHLRVL
jgi:hypothetical protein